MSSETDTTRSTAWWKRSVFPKAAAAIAAVLVATGLVALLVGAFFAYRGALGLVEQVVAVQVDALAEEVETRAAPLDSALADLPELLLLDLALRLPDPIYLVEADGSVSTTILPDQMHFEGQAVAASAPVWSEGERAKFAEVAETGFSEGRLLIETELGSETYAFAPLFSAQGEIAGGLLVTPLDATVGSVLEGPRRAFVNALYVVAAGAVVLALILAALVTAQLVRPLRIMTRRVERIGAGDYEARLDITSEDEFGRLGSAIDQMAADVSASVETLRETSRMRRELIANVGHDLRTPLAALLGNVEEAERMSREGRTSEAYASLESARRQGDYLSSLVSDLFELAVLDGAPTPLRTEPIPLAELLHSVTESHRKQMEASGIHFETQIPSDLPTLEADGVRLLRLLDNLLSNARRHTPIGGTIHLAAQTQTDAVSIMVADDGEGMAPEILAHVFERYYRGKDARTRSGRTGLGLSISRAIAQAHGGTLEATSQPGEGATFTLRLPV